MADLDSDLEDGGFGDTPPGSPPPEPAGYYGGGPAVVTPERRRVLDKVEAAKAGRAGPGVGGGIPTQYDDEIRRLREQLAGGAIGAGADPALGGGDYVEVVGVQAAREEKLRDLAKKNRALRLELSKERAEVSKLRAQVSSLQAGTVRARRPDAAAAGGRVGEEPSEGPSAGGDAAAGVAASKAEVRGLKEELRAVGERLEAMRRKEQTASQQCTRLQEALRREVGEDVPLPDIMAGTLSAQGWRGRAQQLSLLKDRLRATREELAAAQGSSGDGTRGSAGAGQLGAATQAAAARTLAAQNESIRLGLEVESLQGQLDAAKTRASKEASRRAVLEKEVSSLKGKLKMLIDKADTDDRLVSALKEEVERLNRAHAAASRAAAQATAKADPDAGKRVFRAQAV